MIRAILLTLALCTAVNAQVGYWKGRSYTPNSFPRAEWCNCSMCQSLRQQWASYSKPKPTPIIQSSESLIPITERVPVTKKVKRCNGRQCWYEDVTVYETRVRYVSSQKTSNEDELLHCTDLVPTPYEAVNRFLEVANPKSTDVLYDLGCGDGRILIAASRIYGCRSVGIDLNADSLELAEEKIDLFGLGSKIRLYEGDILDYSLKHATIVTVYLYPELIEKILPKIPKGCKVVSYMHEIPGSSKYQFGEHVFYEWVNQ